MLGIATRHRTNRINELRTFCGKVEEIDEGITRKVINKLGPKESKVYKYITTGGYVE